MEDHRHHHQGYDIQDLCHLNYTSRPSPMIPAVLFPPISSTPDHQCDPFRALPPVYVNHHLLSSIQGLVSDPDPDRAPFVGGTAPESPSIITSPAKSPWAGDGNLDGALRKTNSVNMKMDFERRGDAGGGGGRWPRQETLTLLQIRSRLDLRFKQANHKGPLWDEVSRIMLDEYGYQRSGKKCREKFENLYKYYKKTKEGKAGRQDGKHYRFFRQLEALYGESAATGNQIALSSLVVGDDVRAPLMFRLPEMVTPGKNDVVGPSNSATDGGLCEESVHSLPGYTDETYVSMEGHNEDKDTKAGKKGKGKRCWKEKIREFVDSRVRKLMEKQEEWLHRMTRALEEKEKERVVREEEWRRREAERFEREQEFWEKERAWVEARDAAFMDAVRRLSMGDREVEIWKANCQDGMETIAKKKRKELDSRYSFGSRNYAEADRHEEFEHTSTAAATRSVPDALGVITNNGSSSSPSDSRNDNDGENSSNGVHHQDLNCLRYLIGDAGVGDHNLWDNYELKINK